MRMKIRAIYKFSAENIEKTHFNRRLECIFDLVNAPVKKKLSEMTLEELWQLFPIVLTEHRDCWAEWYREESEIVRAALSALFKVDDRAEVNRISFNKGYTEDGFAEKVFHLHLRHEGDNAEIRFRDCLRANPSVAKEYEALKLSLWKRFEHDRDGYTEAKSEFVCKYSEER